MAATRSDYQPPAADPEAAKTFLRVIGKDPDKTFFRTFAPGKGANRARSGKDLSGFNALALQQDNKSAAIYFVTGDGQPSDGAVKDEHITACPALFVEWDHLSKEKQINAWRDLGLPEPTAMVDTGGKSIHAYWRLRDPISPDQWRRITSRLIEHCASDVSVKNPSRVMRLPGYAYWDKNEKPPRPNGNLAQLVHQSDCCYSAEEIEACLPEPEAPATEKTPVAKNDSLASGIKPNTAAALLPRSEEEIRRAAAKIPTRIGGEGTYPADRNALCGCSAALEEAGVGDPDSVALELLGDRWPNVAEARQVLESTTTRNAASFWAIAKENGYDLRRSDVETSARLPGPEPLAQPELTFDDQWQALEDHASELACQPWPVMKAIASLSRTASDLDIPRLGQRQLEQLLEQGQRRVRAKAKPVAPGGSFTIKATPWAVEGIFRHGLNLLVGQSGAGKSRLAAACMAAWLRGDDTWIGQSLSGDDRCHRHALIVGTDQPLEDWHLTLGPVGLTRKISDTEVQVHDRLTLYGLEAGLQLDADGLSVIRRWVDAHPGGMVLIDSLSACLPPGVDEDKSSAARPVHQLQEVLGDAWAILTHHTRKGAGKEGNLGVGAGRGSGAIDAAVSRVVGLGLIHKMENGQMVAQESDPRRELISTKRGGKTQHLIVSSDATGFWDVHGTAEALKAQERQQRTLAGLTEAQSDVLSAVESVDGWLTTREVVEAMGEEYDPRSGRAATVRQTLKRLEVLGLIESTRPGSDRRYRARVSALEQREDELDNSLTSPAAAQGISLPHPDTHLCSHPRGESPAGVSKGESPEPAANQGEHQGEAVKSQSPQGVSQVRHPPSSPPPSAASTRRSQLPDRSPSTDISPEQVEQILNTLPKDARFEVLNSGLRRWDSGFTFVRKKEDHVVLRSPNKRETRCAFIRYNQTWRLAA